MSEQQSKLLPFDVAVLQEMVADKLKTTINPTTVQNLISIQRKLSIEYRLAEVREQEALDKIVANYLEEKR